MTDVAQGEAWLADVLNRMHHSPHPLDVIWPGDITPQRTPEEIKAHEQDRQVKYDAWFKDAIHQVLEKADAKQNEISQPGGDTPAAESDLEDIRQRAAELLSTWRLDVDQRANTEIARLNKEAHVDYPNAMPAPGTPSVQAAKEPVAGVYAAVHAALCALALEFVCSTATLTLDLWDREYGLPDACDPYANLCAKVAALGGVTCAYYEEIAAALGWSIVCGAPCSAPLGICFRMGSTPLGPVSSAATLIVVVDLENSPAFEGVQGYGIRMGCYAMGQANTCGPDLTALDCVLQRIVGAHVTLDYVTF